MPSLYARHIWRDRYPNRGNMYQSYSDTHSTVSLSIVCITEHVDTMRLYEYTSIGVYHKFELWHFTVVTGILPSVFLSELFLFAVNG